MISLVTGRMTQKIMPLLIPGQVSPEHAKRSCAASQAPELPARFIIFPTGPGVPMSGAPRYLQRCGMSAVLGPAVQRTRAHAEFLVSSLAFSSAPRLVVPALAGASDVCF